MGTQGHTICPHSIVRGSLVGRTATCPQTGRDLIENSRAQADKGGFGQPVSSSWAAVAFTTYPRSHAALQPKRCGGFRPVPAALGSPYSQVFLLLPLDTKPGRVKRAR